MKRSFEEIAAKLSAEDQRVIRDISSHHQKIDLQTKEFAKKTGLRCLEGCGACCENPEIETTATEMLPLAVHLWAQGLAEAKLDAIRSDLKGTCVFYQPDPAVKGKGRCGVYQYRPGLCRLFGFAAREDKYGKRNLITCKHIKGKQSGECRQAQDDLREGALQAPLVTEHARTVAGIDPVHGIKLLPINKAVRSAIEKIGYYLESRASLDNHGNLPYSV